MIAPAHRIFSGCFEMAKEVEAFHQSYMELVGQLLRDSRAQVLSEENVLRFRHGRQWSHPANDFAKEGGFHTASAEGTIPFKSIVNADITVLLSGIAETMQSLDRQFYQAFYATVSEACDRSGNVVSAANAGSNAAAFKEMLEKIELSVGRDGEVATPQIHANQETAQKIIADFEGQSAEFKAEIEALKAMKIAQAHEKEDARKAKFKALAEQ